MTNHWIDLQHSDCILIQGSNAAENHPISFKWVLKAKDKGAEVIHVDPRFTRTSARSSMYAPLRSGTDIAFLGGMIKYILDHDLYFKDYVLSYTNAAFLVNPKFSFNDGLFSGYDAQKHAYDKSSWSFQKDGKGLNLCWEVRNGIITHTKGAWARTMEGCTVRYADHIAFLNHDIEDAVAAGVLNPTALPRDAVQVLGDTKSRRITTMITDLVANSANCKNGKMQFSPEVEEAYGVLKDFMYSTVYVDKDAKREEKKVDKMIEALYERLCADPTLMPNFYMQVAYHQGMDRAVADYISGMSDEFATRLFEELFVPQKWQVL